MNLSFPLSDLFTRSILAYGGIQTGCHRGPLWMRRKRSCKSCMASIGIQGKQAEGSYRISLRLDHASSVVSRDRS